MPTITRFEEIEAWQTARELTRLIYQMTSCGEFARDFGLRDQIRRASVSVMSNSAEGYESLTHLCLSIIWEERKHPLWRLTQITSRTNLLTCKPDNM